MIDRPVACSASTLQPTMPTSTDRASSRVGGVNFVTSVCDRDAGGRPAVVLASRRRRPMINGQSKWVCLGRISALILHTSNDVFTSPVGFFYPPKGEKKSLGIFFYGKKNMFLKPRNHKRAPSQFKRGKPCFRLPLPPSISNHSSF